MADPNPLMQIEAHKSMPKDAASLDEMTLRDWFAGQAILSMPGPIHDDGYADARASAADRQADAMIKARSR